jgi:large subunit ribosomal protein L30
MAYKIKITQTRSIIGCLPKQRATIRSLGLGKIGRSVEHDASQAVMGMVNKVAHLVKVENCD